MENKKRLLITGGSGFIGTFLEKESIQKSYKILNIDIEKPKVNDFLGNWVNCNILDFQKLNNLVVDFCPDYVIHLAARTNTSGRSIDEFLDNTIGTKNLIDLIKEQKSINRVIITSSQHVRKPGSLLPKNETDFSPHGFYGESKVITEQETRNARLKCDWTIIRPTTVWGPMHPFLPSGLWRTMKKGIYIHPRNDPVIRGYGYVKNVAWQIMKLLDAPSEKVNHKVFYVGDRVQPQIDWINHFSQAITGHNVRQVPKDFIKLLALCGDTIKGLGGRFPMDSPRFFNLTTTNPVPMDPIFDLLGEPPYSFKQGVEETVTWLNEHGYY